MASNIFQQILRFFAAEPKSDLIAPCQDHIQLADQIDSGHGVFEVSGSRIDFNCSTEAGLTKKPVGACAIVDFSERAPRYFVGTFGQELTLRDRTAFFRELFQLAPSPSPTWLANPFTFTNRSRAWRIDNFRPVFYRLGSERMSAYDALLTAGRKLSSSPGKYFDVVEFDVQDVHTMKRNAGAARILERRNLQISNSIPSMPSFNLKALTFHEGSRDIYFLPDFVAVRTGRKFAMISYRDLDCRVQDGRYITPEVPPGVQPIDFTWQYVNRDGGPDRRFSNNFQIPVIACTELDLIARSGLQIHTAFTSRSSVGEFVSALERLQSLE